MGQGKALGTSFPGRFYSGAKLIFFRVLNEKTVLLRNCFMHMPLCFHSTSKANEIRAKKRLRRLPAVEPLQSTHTLHVKEIKQSNLPV